MPLNCLKPRYNQFYCNMFLFEKTFPQIIIKKLKLKRWMGWHWVNILSHAGGG